MTPTEWLPEARSVVSFFFPFTEEIRKSNRQDMAYPSNGWLNGRIEGQAFIREYTADIVRFLTGNGYAAMAPSLDARAFSEGFEDAHNRRRYTTNWSERHAAYVCGLGIFGLSAGLITEKGMAGRLTSVITALNLEPDRRCYERYNEYCAMCGKCARNCPAQAIDIKRGKDHAACSRFLDAVKADLDPWYGCGKCQVNVPCESGKPGRRATYPRS